MITINEIKDFVKIKGKDTVMNCISELADLYFYRETLLTLEKGTPKYNALEKQILFYENRFFKGKKTPYISDEESFLIANVKNASDEFIEEYKKRVDEILKEME